MLRSGVVSIPVKQAPAGRVSEEGLAGVWTVLAGVRPAIHEAVFVVINQPLFGDSLDLLQIGEQVRVEHFSTICTVEALNEDILIRFARLNITHGNPPRSGPLGEGLRDHLRPVVQPYGLMRTVAIHQAIQHTHQVCRRDRGPNLDGQAFSVGLVDHVQRPEASAAVQGIEHEVQCPASVRRQGTIQRLAWPAGQLLLAASKQIQSPLAVHPVNPLFVPATTIEPQPRQALSEPPAAIPSHNRIVSASMTSASRCCAGVVLLYYAARDRPAV